MLVLPTNCLGRQLFIKFDTVGSSTSSLHSSLYKNIRLHILTLEHSKVRQCQNNFFFFAVGCKSSGVFLNGLNKTVHGSFKEFY